jgi:AcrR family transcriptional regulator
LSISDDFEVGLYCGAVVDPAASVRERKRQATRDAVVEVSGRLFRERGFDGTTLEQIAEQCMVSARTILRLFGTKEALALAPEHDGLRRLLEQLRQSDAGAVASWRTYIGELVETCRARPAAMRRRLRTIFDHPALHAEMARVGLAMEDALADAINAETGGANPLGSSLLAIVLVRGNRTVMREWLDGDGTVDPKILLDTVDQAVAAFHPDVVPRR